MKKTAIVIVLAAVLCFAIALQRLEQGHRAQGRQQLEDAIRAAAVSCYAQEGFYPPDVDYLQAHYGLRYDREVYAVRYTLTASNLMPDITVLERQK